MFFYYFVKLLYIFLNFINNKKSDKSETFTVDFNLNYYSNYYKY